ncbi:MAG: exo-alpha-sialidase, partial [Planctomycetes bacterium]|nr:exo-alpha-sialidase [Planctomycetota bacterium]
MIGRSAIPFASFIAASFLAPWASPPAGAAAMRIDLASSGAADRWVLVSDTARIEGAELVLDGRRARSDAFFAPQVWSDVTLRAKFLVEPASEGVLACGFIVRAKDARTFYAVHFDRAQAILYRSTPEDAWIEIKRVSGLDKPAGRWHEGVLACDGKTLRVSLNDKLLYEAEDATLGEGRIGFYANQGIAHVKEIEVLGDPRPATEKLAIPGASFVRVCEDAGAGGYEAFPDVCRLADGRLMAVFYAGYGHISVPNETLPRGGRISYAVSEDEGKTWGAARILYDGPGDDRDPSITQLADGRLACVFFTGGRGSWLVESRDGGATWSEARQLFPRHYVSAPIREISGGRLVLGLYREEGGIARGAATTSDEGGATWSEPVDIDNAGKYLDAETDIIERQDGTLLAVQRGGRGAEMHAATSADRGRTWSVSKAMGFPGHCPYLHRTVDGIVLLAYRSVAGGMKTGLRESFDDGATWGDETVVDRTVGAYPSMVNLRDGSVLIVYYEEGAGSSIRAKRFRATRAGIEWLEPADDAVANCGARLVEVRKIWDRAPHNAFT